MEEHAQMRRKKIKCESVPYMNSQFRKVICKRNIAHNIYKKYGHEFWEDTRREKDNVIASEKIRL